MHGNDSCFFPRWSRMSRGHCYIVTATYSITAVVHGLNHPSQGLHRTSTGCSLLVQPATFGRHWAGIGAARGHIVSCSIIVHLQVMTDYCYLGHMTGSRHDYDDDYQVRAADILLMICSY